MSLFVAGVFLNLVACSNNAEEAETKVLADVTGQSSKQVSLAEVEPQKAPRSERLSAVERQFVSAMRQGNLEDAMFYLNEGLVDAKDLSTGHSLVFYLYGSGNCDFDRGDCTPGQDVVQTLISAGFDLDEQFDNARRPISYVCWGRSMGENNARLLTQQGVKVNFTDKDGASALHYCARRRTDTSHENLAEYAQSVTNTMNYLLAAGADIDVRDTRTRPAQHHTFGEPFYQGSTPLMQAVDYVGEVSMRRFNTVEFLLEKGANASLIDANGFGVANYLQYPDRDRKYEPTLDLLRMLHNAGANILHKTPKGQSLETLALDRGDIEFVQKMRAIAREPRGR
ncbi:MAG: hypothetical protein CVT85_00650 [Alphaproteobacteria bacterium HGW-Alphaproteobacteria-7]|nr:MAG: hypothetical protein CVT85_00650 [Alphaproteobacteria bacterium HGW-Alphaproteobacteria-7]